MANANGGKCDALISDCCCCLPLQGMGPPSERRITSYNVKSCINDGKFFPLDMGLQRSQFFYTRAETADEQK